MRKRPTDSDSAAEQGAAKREALAELGGRMDAAVRAVAVFAKGRELRGPTGEDAATLKALQASADRLTLEHGDMIAALVTPARPTRTRGPGRKTSLGAD